ncbi:diguanylate cyclase [Marinobacter sp. NP-4(2019)]|uniref:sensor domain-containing diguanylate cyclase n=1 Tax=Marinobacter sp. NP-4(2019) TaxID=2488665 RepID=UPI000FC3CEEE|nr:diguanylate cyclase [Marinobacter sp. NP-4(2019)]AZT84224.1 diguanylate cyclase [Marinobacter sp. NP-4(2019)]
MQLYLRIFITLTALALAGASPALGAHPGTPCPTLDASTAHQRATLMDHVCFHVAAPGNPAHQAKAPAELPTTLNWQAAEGHDLVFSHTDSVYWVHLHLTNASDRVGFWYLKLNYPLLDDVTFWQDGTSTSTTLATGDQHAFLSRGIDYRYFLLPVTLGAGERQEITLRIRSSGALNVPLSLETPGTVIAESNHLTLTHGLFYGALLVFAVFNLLLFISSGTAYYFHNAFYMASMGMFLFSMGGFANQYFWPDSTGFANTSIPLLIALCSLAMTLFGRSFLEVSPGTLSATTLTAFGWVSAGLLAITFLLPYNKSILLNTLLAMTVISCLFVIGLSRWRQGYAPALWYVLAWSVMLVGSLIYSLAAFGYLTDFLAREFFMLIAIGAQVILLNYAMVQRWRLLNQKLLHVEHNARSELELKVQERTAQLRNTMEELEKANRKLATMSLNDALTGLYNRRHLDNMLPELCAESRRTGQPLTLALVDADHFKSINDNWGHGFGDLCLQRIADVLSRHVKRPRDIAIRFGGEEFALLLPGTNRDGAYRVCQHILDDMQHTPIRTSDGTDVTLTLSAGVAALAPGDHEQALFQRADDALYRAKASGRNQVAIIDADIVQ